MANRTEDPVLRSARREAIIVFITLAVAMTYTVTYCGLYGYETDAEKLQFVLGFPDWVFWGIITPWTACLVFSFVFGGWIMKDEDLGGDSGDEFEEEFNG